MGVAYFGTDQISHDSYVVPRGTSNPQITTYPRTVGGIIQESGVVEKTLILKSYIIPPTGSTRQSLEDFFHLLNEKIGNREDNLTVNGNVYLNANVKKIDYDNFITSGFVRFTVEFQLNNQNTGSVIRQLDVPDLQNFSRGRKLRFVTQEDDGTYRTFEFWHNFDNIRNLDTQITIKQDRPYGGSSRVIRVGGFENIICSGWIIGPDEGVASCRRNLEAYWYNILNGPLGRVGRLVYDDSTYTEKAMFTNLSVTDTTHPTVKYDLTFLASLQC